MSFLLSALLLASARFVPPFPAGGFGCEISAQIHDPVFPFRYRTNLPPPFPLFLLLSESLSWRCMGFDILSHKLDSYSPLFPFSSSRLKDYVPGHDPSANSLLLPPPFCRRGIDGFFPVRWNPAFFHIRHRESVPSVCSFERCAPFPSLPLELRGVPI